MPAGEPAWRSWPDPSEAAQRLRKPRSSSDGSNLQTPGAHTRFRSAIPLLAA